MKSNVNLHIHTTHSDGGKTAAEIVEGFGRPASSILLLPTTTP
jgi:predicted metal-dependent phosphoesterase TrpH